MRKQIFFFWIIFLLSIPSAFSQSRSITGKVIDENGKAVPLATVQQKGTTNAVTANDDGDFSISVTGKNPVLVISSVNYRDEEVKVGNQSYYAISLTGTGELSEVVVTALGITRQKRSLG